MTTMSPDAAVTDHAHRPLLRVRGLEVAFGARRIVSGVDLDLVAGRIVAVVGPSGAGKSAMARSLIGLAGPGSRVRAERFEVADTTTAGAAELPTTASTEATADERARTEPARIDLTAGRERDWLRVRGRLIGLVLQDALVALDPMRTVGRELDEAMGRRPGESTSQRRARAVELLERAGLDDPRAFLDRRADELSGGQRQRALIATAIARSPRILIADEPTASLDPVTRDGILALLRALADDGVAVLLVSHDLEGVARVADEVRELRDGRLQQATEPAALGAPIANPVHPEPDAAHRAPDRETAAPRASAPDGAPLLAVDGVTKTFTGTRGEPVHAVVDATLTLHRGETIGLVGASGSGKTTLGRLVLGLEQPDAGTIALAGERWSPGPESMRRALRGAIGHVPQDALSSFDPRRSVGSILADAFSRGASRSARRHRASIERALDEVGLPADVAHRRPLHLSGGQRQRVAIARALAADPRVLVCDEAVSALDPATRDDVIALLERLRDERGLAMLFISHDPLVTRRISDRIVRMAAGVIMTSSAGVPAEGSTDAPGS